MSLRSVAEQVNLQLSARRDLPPPPPGASYVGSHGQHPRPLTWVARLLGRAKYYGKGGCPEWDNVAWWYQWEEVFTNTNSDLPYPQPVYLFNNIEGTLIEDDWPNKFTLGFEAGKKGLWAVNTAEFDYQEGSGLARAVNSAGTGGGLFAREDYYVVMAMAKFDDLGACAAEPRTPRVIPFFHQYAFPGHEICP